MTRRRAVVLVAGLAIACASRRPAVDDAGPARAARLASLLEGRYSSAAQAALDADFRDIRLVMTRIWTDRTDGPWLYVEQAVAGKEDAPYRQRVYRLVPARDGVVRSVVFALSDPAAAVGAWRSAAPLASLDPRTLVPRTGCDVVLRERADGTFEGGTEGTSCASDLRGAAYATSTATIDATGMVTWDRGFDTAGTQVWGSEKGGYRFRREGP